VLVVEDIPAVSHALQAGLHAAGIEVELAMTGVEAIACALSFKPEFVLVDLDLAGGEASDLVRRFAGQGHCGVIVLTHPDSMPNNPESNLVADEYVSKRIRPRELAARIRTLHQRRMRATKSPRARIVVDHANRCLSGGTRTQACTELSDAELTALDTLLDAQGGSVSRAWLNRVALNRILPDDDHRLDELMLALRRKLAQQGATGRTIQAVRQQGYLIPDSTMFESIYNADK
jgi:DNA-binding response OmpR family regulator